ncbi:AbgT family transporter [Streptomyces sp. NPDC088801]|uniref:AbgT family transporter n=1 Tax=Streptomyces sp. NPDC088801 TaxID=3365903 RepID=UPI00380E7AA2
MLLGVEESFLAFGPLGSMIIIMLGLAVADRSGMLESLDRHALGRVSPGYAVFAVCLAGALSKFLSCSAYVILIPLAALVFRAVGRSPVLGMIVGFLSSRRERRVRPRWSRGLDGAVGVDDNDPVRAVVREGAVLCREDDDVGAGVRKLVSSMLGRPPVTRRTGPGVPAAVTGIRSGVPLSKLVAQGAVVEPEPVGADRQDFGGHRCESGVGQPRGGRSAGDRDGRRGQDGRSSGDRQRDDAVPLRLPETPGALCTAPDRVLVPLHDSPGYISGCLKGSVSSASG